MCEQLHLRSSLMFSEYSYLLCSCIGRIASSPFGRAVPWPVSRFLANVATLTIFGRILLIGQPLLHWFLNWGYSLLNRMMVVQHMGLAYVENIFHKNRMCVENISPKIRTSITYHIDIACLITWIDWCLLNRMMVVQHMGLAYVENIFHKNRTCVEKYFPQNSNLHHLPHWHCLSHYLDRLVQWNDISTNQHCSGHYSASIQY
jgi:hypothetical protein